MKELERVIGYSFKDKSLLKQALTHPSRNNAVGKSYERLEFLGDRVLNLVVAKKLFSLNAFAAEGEMSKVLAALTSGKFCYEVGERIGLEKFIEMSLSTEKTSQRGRAKSVSNCLEALIGAIFIDGTINDCEAFLCKLWPSESFILSKDNSSSNKDYKTILQEWSQSKKLGLPKYIVVNQTGTAHDPSFTICAKVGDMESGHAIGTSKKEAQTVAAMMLLQKLNVLNT